MAEQGIAITTHNAVFPYSDTMEGGLAVALSDEHQRILEQIESGLWTDDQSRAKRLHRGLGKLGSNTARAEIPGKFFWPNIIAFVAMVFSGFVFAVHFIDAAGKAAMHENVAVGPNGVGAWVPVLIGVAAWVICFLVIRVRDAVKRRSDGLGS